MSDEPDFIVDPSGDVQDVRGQKNTRVPHSTKSQKAKSSNPYPDIDDIRYEPPMASEEGIGGGFIIIPIGLIITVILFFFQFIDDGQEPFDPINPGKIDSGKTTFSQAAVQAVEMGMKYFTDGDYDHAIEQYSVAIKADPHMPESWNDRGVVYFTIGEMEKAIADLGQAIKIAPNYAAPYNNRWLVYSILGEHEKAIAEFNKAIDLVSYFVKAYYNRGLVNVNIEEYDQAIADISKAIELASKYNFTYFATIESRPGTTENPYWRDLIYQDNKQHEYEDAQITAALPEAYRMRASVFKQIGEVEKEMADLKKAVELNLYAEIPEEAIPAYEILSPAIPPGIFGEDTMVNP